MQQTLSHPNTKPFTANDLPGLDRPHPWHALPSWQRKYQALRKWIVMRGLQDKRVLEVGCGLGVLQNLIADYVGVDIRRDMGMRLHKPFAACSAETLPFPDNSFDGAWSIWVLEHIPDPERMLSEIRRVVKPGGSIFLCVAYDVPSWVGRGLHKRPWRELSLSERLIKASIPVRSSLPWKFGSTVLRRLGLLAGQLAKHRPTHLHPRPLQASPEGDYWDFDADAHVDLDAYDVALYFLSRGDKPCPPGFPTGTWQGLAVRSQPQTYIISK